MGRCGIRLEKHSGKTVVNLRAKNPKYRTLLSLDGGGAKAVIPISVLQKFQDIALEIAREDDRCKDVPKGDLVMNVGDCFDVVSGNSSGSIVALYLASGGGCKNLYEGKGSLKGLWPGSMEAAMALVVKLLPTIFTKNWFSFGFWTKYKREGLEDAMDEMFGDMHMKDLKMNTYIPAFELNNRRGVGFSCQPGAKKEEDISKYMHCRDVLGIKKKEEAAKNGNPLRLIDKKGVDVPVSLVAQASGSAPTFFPITTSKDSKLLGQLELEEEARWADGGVVSNNPTMQALGFMTLVFAKEGSKELLPISKMAVMSIGTGTTKAPVDIPWGGQGILGWVKELLFLFMESHLDVNHKIIDAVFDGVSFGGEKGDFDRYVRINRVAWPGHEDFGKMGKLDSIEEEDIENFKELGSKLGGDDNEFKCDIECFIRDIIMVEADE